MARKQALGRGLDALIKAPDSSSRMGVPTHDGDSGERVQFIDVDEIIASPLQPRKRFAESAIQELSESIREHGVIQPLILRRVDDDYELIAGERRFRACQLLELDQVPAIVRDASDADVLEMALIENLQREDLNPIEEAEAYRKLAREFGMRQEDIAKRVGKSRAAVANAIRLLELAPDVQVLVSQGTISNGHAKAILGLKEHEEQQLLAEFVVQKHLTVRDTEKLVTEKANGAKTGKTTKAGAATPHKAGSSVVPNFVRNIQDRLRGRLATRVAISHNSKKGGKIEIDYYDNEDLGRILELLGIEQD
ncbi:MAG: ParB/RepB/Spo0J family partition protein [Verrucomicrobiota bacterium]